MLRTIEQFIFRRLTPLSIRHLSPPDIAGASGLVAEVCLQLDREFMAVPPVTLHHLNPQLMAGVWSACRESLVVGPDRTEKELIAVAVSQSNHCPYCVQAHTSMLLGADNRSALDAVTTGRKTGDPLAALAAWASATGRKSAIASIAPPFTKSQAAAFMATAVLFHYINRMVTIFLDDTMMPLVGNVPVVGEQAFRVFSSLTSARIVRIEAAPCRFLTEQPVITLPEAFGWASADAGVSGGLLRLAAAVNDIAGTIDPEVRLLVDRQVAIWEGEVPALGKGWLDGAVSELPEKLRPQARLALLAALAPWMADDGEVKACRLAGFDDRALLETAAWGAWLATVRIAGWMQIHLTNSTG